MLSFIKAKILISDFPPVPLINTKIYPPTQYVTTHSRTYRKYFFLINSLAHKLFQTRVRIRDERPVYLIDSQIRIAYLRFIEYGNYVMEIWASASYRFSWPITSTSRRQGLQYETNARKWERSALMIVARGYIKGRYVNNETSVFYHANNCEQV